MYCLIINIMSYKLLKKWIRLVLERDIIGEPDETNKDSRGKDDKSKKKKSEMSVGGVAGVTTPLGTGPTYPNKIVKKSKKRKRK